MPIRRHTDETTRKPDGRLARTRPARCILACCLLAAGGVSAWALPNAPSPQGTATGQSVQAQASRQTPAAASAKAAASDASDTSDASSVTVKDGDNVGTSFTVGKLGYTVLSLPSDSEPGTVTLSSVDAELKQAAVPAQVEAPSGNGYQVVKVAFAAFENHGKLTDVELPGSVSSCVPDRSGAAFSGCSSLKSLSVSGHGKASFLSSADGVLYACKDGEELSLLRYPQAKEGSAFSVPESVSTVCTGAFAGNTSLESVSFSGDLCGVSGTGSIFFLGGIGSGAFKGCTALAEVSFAQGMSIATASTGTSAAIGDSAFAGCTALKNIAIPPITSADVKGNAYKSFAELNPSSNLAVGADASFTSGYTPYWHNNSGPVARSGIGGGAFEGCTALESVTLTAGARNGAFAYWTGNASVFKGCTALKSLVYEGTQAYWGRPGATLQNGASTYIWSESYNGIDDPTYYYAVDYYATKDDVDAADASGSTRIARMEFEQGTSTSLIASSSKELAAHSADSALYASKEADGTAPDPNQAAQEAGLGEGDWVWKLDNTQSRRSGLSDSCRAYLVKADSLDAARLDAAQIDAEYLQADRNLSQGTSLAPGSAFDAQRYASDTYYVMTPFDGEQSPFFTFDPTTKTVDGGFQVTLADGSALDSGACTIGYRHLDKTTSKLGEVESSIDATGAWLVSVEAAGTTGTFTEWILVKNRDGKLVEAFGADSSCTEHGAKYAYSQTSSIDYSGSAYSITVGAKDADSALVASACAGLAHGAINVNTDVTSTSWGFTLNRSTYPNGSVKDSGKSKTFTRGDASASAFAVAVYRHFADADARSSYGLGADDAWGDTALLVGYGRSADVASICAYAYALKAPVFFAEKDGSCSKGTLACLKDFAQVKVCGNTTLFSKAAFKKLAGSVTGSCTRIASDAGNSGNFSLSVARALIGMGAANCGVACVSDGADPLDCVLSLNLSGHEGGITLVTKSTAQSKAIASFLHANAEENTLVMLFGRNASKAARLVSKNYGTANAYGAVWKSDSAFESAMKGVSITATDPGFQPLKDAASKKSKKKGKASGKGNANRRSAGAGSGGSSSSNSSVNAGAGGSSSSAKDGASNASASGSAGASRASAQQASATPQVSEAQGTDDEATPGQPWWLKLIFMAAVVGLAALLIPVLRRCR